MKRQGLPQLPHTTTTHITHPSSVSYTPPTAQSCPTPICPRSQVVWGLQEVGQVGVGLSPASGSYWDVYQYLTSGGHIILSSYLVIVRKTLYYGLKKQGSQGPDPHIILPSDSEEDSGLGVKGAGGPRGPTLTSSYLVIVRRTQY